MVDKQRRIRGMRETRKDQIFLAIDYFLMFFAIVVILYPLLIVISSSFSAPEAIVSGRVWLLPVEPTLKGYETVFKYRPVWTGYYNSLIYASVGTAFNVVMTILAAYPLSRKDFFGRNQVMALFVFTMLFSGGLIPTYLLVRNLGLLDTRAAMILPTALSVFAVIVTRTYFQTTLPNDLLEASKLDGCNDFRFVWSVAVPLSGPVIAVISLWYAVGHWNTYFSALIYLKSDSLYPLQIILRNILIQHDFSPEMLARFQNDQQQALRELLKYSLIVVAVLPVLMIYPFVQRYFVKGVMIGAIKG